MYACRKKRTAFTLVELIVVVMILGILASIAAPKLLGTSQVAAENGVRQTLSTIRDAIDMFAAEHSGSLPGADGLEATFKSDIRPYLRGSDFPMCTVDATKFNDVAMLSGSDQPGALGGPGAPSWAYNYETGAFHINSQDLSSDGVTTYDQF
jgi:general secretion pathway protein G